MIKEKKHRYLGRVTKNERLTHIDHFQEIRHLEFIYSDKITYNPGDAASIIPKNSHKDVTEFIELMQFNEHMDKNHEIKHKVNGCEIVEIMTLKELIQTKIDLTSTPKYAFLEYIKFFCNENELYKAKIEEWLNVKESFNDFAEYSQKPKRTIIEFLKDFKIKIPLHYVLDAIPPIFPRYFSISSSNKVTGNAISIMIGVIRYKTIMKNERLGLCTNWISKSLQVGDCIEFGIAKGSLSLPKNKNTPVIMISPGLGVAPMRALIQERIHDKEFENYLFVGARYKDKDYCYGKEWEAYSKDQKLNLYTAFSRDKEEKVYVQHLLIKNRVLVKKLIAEHNAYLYICGSSGSMPKQVLNAIRDVIQNDETYSLIEKGANSQKGRLWVESWS